MTIHPGDRTYIKPEDVIHDSDDFYEPFLIVEGTMSDSQMKNIRQIQSAEKPAKDKINSAYQHSHPGSQMSWGEIHTSQHVGKNNQIASDVVYFHEGSPWVLFKQKLEPTVNQRSFFFRGVWFRGLREAFGRGIGIGEGGRTGEGSGIVQHLEPVVGFCSGMEIPASRGVATRA
jgi:hypothetical protein